MLRYLCTTLSLSCQRQTEEISFSLYLTCIEKFLDCPSSGIFQNFQRSFRNSFLMWCLKNLITAQVNFLTVKNEDEMLKLKSLEQIRNLN